MLVLELEYAAHTLAHQVAPQSIANSVAVLLDYNPRQHLLSVTLPVNPYAMALALRDTLETIGLYLTDRESMAVLTDCLASSIKGAPLVRNASATTRDHMFVTGRFRGRPTLSIIPRTRDK